MIEEYIKNRNKADFLKSKQLQDAIIRRVEIIGEAIKNIPDDFKKTITGIPWKQITGMRDILIHQYFGIDLDLMWEVVKKDLPELKKQIIEINSKIES